MNTSYTVPTANIVAICITLLISVCLPIILLIWYRVKKKADIVVFFLGCAIFIIFAMVLESMLHGVMVGGNSAVSKTINANIWLYALYGGLAAGVFEETGRYVAFRFLLKSRLRKENALMYGAGHGGVEAILITGMTMVNNLVLAFAVNNGQLETMLSAAQQAGAGQQLENGIQQLSTAAPVMILMGGVERIIAITLHIALSVLVYVAVTQKGHAWLFPVAIGLHALVDFCAVVLGNKISAYVVEAVVAILTLAIGAFAWKLYHDLHEEVPAVNAAGDGREAVSDIAGAEQVEAVSDLAETGQEEAVSGIAGDGHMKAVSDIAGAEQREAVSDLAETGQKEAVSGIAGDGHMKAVSDIAGAGQREAVSDIAGAGQREAVSGIAGAEQREAVSGIAGAERTEAVPDIAEAAQNEAAQNGPDAESEEK